MTANLAATTDKTTGPKPLWIKDFCPQQRQGEVREKAV
jgi:hypothetical protein